MIALDLSGTTGFLRHQKNLIIIILKSTSLHLVRRLCLNRNRMQLLDLLTNTRVDSAMSRERQHALECLAHNVDLELSQCLLH